MKQKLVETLVAGYEEALDEMRDGLGIVAIFHCEEADKHTHNIICLVCG